MFGHSLSYAPSPLPRALLCGELVTLVQGSTQGLSCHTLEEVSCPLSHPGVDKGLGSLDVVVEVVSEGLDVGDDLCSSLHSQMAWEENYRCQLRHP
jgi:hypothetical protein